MADTNNTERAEWKLGDEYLPFHPSASHVDPAYRDGWNACFQAGRSSLAAGGESVAWTGGEEWEPLAWHLCAEENGEEACGQLIWEGGPIPEPWGERWMKYEHDAKQMIELVRKFSAPQPAHALGDGWMPIETAPKDGTPVLVSWPVVALDEDFNHTDKIACRHTLVTYMLGGFWQDPGICNACGSSFDDDHEFAEQPDQWQPLPAPAPPLSPNESKGEKP